MAGWISTKESMRGLLSSFSERQKQEQELKQKLGLMLMEMQMKAQMQQQIQQQNPANQLNQIRLAQALQGLQQQNQFNRQADIGFGGQNPNVQEALPLVPQHLRQKFMQRPVSPPGLVESLRQKIRQPYEQSGQTLVPGQKGWERVARRITPLPANNKISIPQGFEITGYDQKGQPMLRKIKPSQAQEKRDVEIRELGGQINNLVGFFQQARQESDSTTGIGTSGVGGRIAGKYAVTKGKLGYSPAVNVYQDKIKAFATIVAKAAGEVRPTDEDIKRFIQTLPSLEKNDQENAIIINQLYNDLEARGAKAVWEGRVSGKLEQNNLTSLKSKYGLR